MMDFFAASLVPLGAPLASSLVMTSGLLGLAFPAVLYLAAQRFTGGRAAAVLAVFAFLLGGGLGFYQLVASIQHGGLGGLMHLPPEDTLHRALNFPWPDPVAPALLPP